MTPERFADLAEAWGARLQRWPDAEQKAAEQLLRGMPLLQAVLDRQALLERLLDAHAVPAPGLALVAAVHSGAPHPVRQPTRRPWARGWPAGGWSGAGIVGLSLAGVAAGALAGVMVVSTAFDAVAPLRAMAGVDAGWTRTAFDTRAVPLEGADE